MIRVPGSRLGRRVHEEREEPSKHLAVFATVALAGVLRFGHLAFLAARDPLFLHPVVDSWYHSKEALAILTLGPALPGAGAFYKPPLYSYLLAVLYALFGSTAGAVAARVVSILCGCAAVYFAGRVAWRLGGARAGWMAGLAVAVYGTAVLSDTQILQISIVNALALAACDRLVASLESEAPERVLLVAGVLLGLLAVTRTDGLIATAFAFIWAAWPDRGRRTIRVTGEERSRRASRGTEHDSPGNGDRSPPRVHGNPASRPPSAPPRHQLARRASGESSGAGAGLSRLSSVRAGVCVLVPALLVVAPVTLRNAVLEHDPVLISWNGGINLFIGNDPGFDQASGNWHADLAWMRVYNAPGDLGLIRGADHQRFFLEQMVRAAFAEPLTRLRILAGKVSLLFSDYEVSNNQRISEARSYSPLLALLMPQWRWLALPFGVAGPLIAAGLALAWGRLGGRERPVVLIAAAWALVSVAFFNTERYRLPVILLLIPVAAAGWSRVREILDGARAKPIGRAADPHASRIEPAGRDGSRSAAHDGSRRAANDGSRAANEGSRGAVNDGSLTDSVHRGETTRQADPLQQESLTSRGCRTRLALACGAALAVAINGSLSIPARTTLPLSATLDLADVADLAGDLNEAFRLRTKAVEEDPDDPFARIRLGDTLRRLKRYVEAKEQYAAVLSRSDLAADWHNAATRSTARCYFGLKQFGEASDWYRKFIEAGPDTPYTGTRPDFHLRGIPPLQACWIRLELSDALSRDGRRNEAATELRRVTSDCAASPKLLEQAAGRMQALARARGDAGSSQ